VSRPAVLNPIRAKTVKQLANISLTLLLIC